MNKTPQSNVFLMDNMEGMRQYPDKYFQLAVCDPPYGINADQKKGRYRKEQAHKAKGLSYRELG